MKNSHNIRERLLKVCLLVSMVIIGACSDSPGLTEPQAKDIPPALNDTWRSCWYTGFGTASQTLLGCSDWNYGGSPYTPTDWPGGGTGNPGDDIEDACDGPGCPILPDAGDGNGPQGPPPPPPPPPPVVDSLSLLVCEPPSDFEMPSDIELRLDQGNSQGAGIAAQLPDVTNRVSGCEDPITAAILSREIYIRWLKKQFDDKKCNGAVLCNKLFERYLRSMGDYDLPQNVFDQIIAAVNKAGRTQPFPFTRDGQSYTSYKVNFYNGQYDYTFGTATVVYDQNDNAVGFVDEWNLDWHIFIATNRTAETEWNVRIASILTVPLFPSAFETKYGIQPPPP